MIVLRLEFERDRRVDRPPYVREDDQEDDTEHHEDVPDFHGFPDRVPPTAFREGPVRPAHAREIGADEHLVDREARRNRERRGCVEDEPRGRDRHEDRGEGPDRDEAVRRVPPARDLPQQVRDRGEAHAEREDAERQDDLGHPRRLVFRDGRDDLRLDEVPGAREEGAREGRVHEDADAESHAGRDQRARDDERPRIVAGDGEGEAEDERREEQIRGHVEPHTDLDPDVVPLESQHERRHKRDRKQEPGPHRVLVPEPGEEQLRGEPYEHDDDHVGPALPSEGDHRDAEAGEEGIQDAGPILPEERPDARGNRLPSEPVLDPPPAVHRLQRAEEEVERRDDEEQGEGVVVRIRRSAPLQVPHADREEERADEARLPAERLLREAVRRDDREGPEEPRTQQPDEDDRVPRVAEEGREQPSGEEREPRVQRRPRVLEGNGIVEHGVAAQVSPRLERITQRPVPIVRVRPARVGRRVDGGAVGWDRMEGDPVHEVGAQEQREAED